ncbi:MAG TPA: TIGR02099 family protein, partial [Ramlibacter sp.]
MIGSPPQPSRLLKASAACAKWALGLLAACCLLIAAAWGALHGWIVPRIGEYRPAMERQASRALGVPVRIGAVAAHSQGLVPSIELQAVELLDDQGHAALRLQRVLVAVSLGSLWNRGFDQLFVDAPELDVRRATDGRIYVAGLDLSTGERSGGSGADWFFRQGEFVIRGGTLR